jgi:ATP-binding cassette subfamily B protein
VPEEREDEDQKKTTVEELPEKGGFDLAADDEADLRPIDLSVARKLVPYVRPFAKLVLLGAGLVLLKTGIGLLGPKLQGQILDAVAVSLKTPERDASPAIRIAAILLAVQTVLFFLTWAQGYTLSILGQRVLFNLRHDLFAHIEGLSSAFFQRWPVGRLVSRVANDVEALAELFSTGLVTIVGDIATIVGVTAVLLASNFKLALVTLAALPVLFAITAGFRQPVRRAHREVRRRMAKLAAFLNERITGVRVVRAFAAEAEDEVRFRAVNEHVYAGYRRTVHLDGMFNPGIFAASSFAVAGLLWVGGIDVIGGKITPGELFAFLGYTQWLFMPIRDMAEKYTLIQKAMASSERIVELLGVKDDVPDPAAPLPLPAPLRGELALEGVSFAYVAGAPPALEDVSLRVAPGETLAIVGATGAGKSTIANLVSRFWDPTAGRVTLDGIDLRQLRKHDLRRAVALVLQDVFLFAGTIEENIALKPGPLSPEDRARVEAAAKAVAAHEIIERLGGYTAVVEERGATLSQGERQLISFARALAQNPSVLLLDEATASLDPDTEARLQAGVKALTKGRTAIVIAHRLATVREASRIAVLHRGKLRELGTHDELVKKDGLYARLVELQMGAPLAAVDGRGA